MPFDVPKFDLSPVESWPQIAQPTTVTFLNVGLVSLLHSGPKKKITLAKMN